MTILLTQELLGQSQLLVIQAHHQVGLFLQIRKQFKKSESAEAVYQLDKTLNDIEQGESSDATITESTTNLADMKEEKSFSF